MRGSVLPQGRLCAAPCSYPPGRGRQCLTSAAAHPSAPAPQPALRGPASKYEPCEPSCSSRGPHELSLADFGARMTLERIYRWDMLEGPPATFAVTVDDRPQRTRNSERSEGYFANVGDAIRCLREDIPALFDRELNYDIYREDIVFRDPRNCFKGMKNYQTVFWSLRFHGKLFFSKLYVDVKRIWQPEDGLIKMRWTVHGIPRVPWEAEGTFDGISTYKLDSTGKIYEHSVDNILLRDPPMATNPPLLAGINLQPLVPSQQPVPGAWCQGMDMDLSWSSDVQRMLYTALQGGAGEPEPAAALAGMSMGAHAQHGPQQQQPHSTQQGAAAAGKGGAGGRQEEAGSAGQGAAARRRQRR